MQIQLPRRRRRFSLPSIVTGVLMVPVIAFLTMKGGVGKTTLAANLTRSLADYRRRKILLIDADAQCNLSQIFFDSDDIEASANRSLFNAFDTRGRALFASDVKKTVHPLEGSASSGSVIDFVMGSFDTFELNATANAARRQAAAQRFKSFIDQAKNEYDLIAIDTNPSATFVTMQALENSNFLVAPITFDAFSMQGIHLVVSHMKEQFPWLGNPMRLALVANKVPRNPSESAARRLIREEDKIRRRHPVLSRSIKLERIHASDLIANRLPARGFLADNNGIEGGIYAKVVGDFDDVARAIDLDLQYAFDTTQAESPPPTERPSWPTWFGLSAPGN